MKSIRDKLNNEVGEAGFTLLEMLVVCCVSLGLLSLGSIQLKRHLHRQANQMVAYHLRLVTDAAKYYVKDHYEALSTSASQGFETQITVEELKAAGYLSEAVNSVNLLGQTYTIQVAATEADKQVVQLSILVLSRGGCSADQADLQEIAGYAGADAGYVDQRSNGHVLSGLGGSWSVEHLSDVSYGHFGSLNFVQAHEILDAKSFLLRKQIPNHPSYNEMETDLSLGSHQIYGLKEKASYTISAASGILLCAGETNRAVFDGKMLSFESDVGSSTLDSERLSFDNSSTKTSLSDQLSIESASSSFALSAEEVQLSKGSDLYANLSVESGLSLGDKSLFKEHADLFFDRRTRVEFNGAHIRFPFYEIPYSKEKGGVVVGDQIDTSVDGLFKSVVKTVCDFSYPKNQESTRSARTGRSFLVGYNGTGIRLKILVVCTYNGACLFPAVGFYSFY